MNSEHRLRAWGFVCITAIICVWLVVGCEQSKAATLPPTKNSVLTLPQLKKYAKEIISASAYKIKTPYYSVKNCKLTSSIQGYCRWGITISDKTGYTICEGPIIIKKIRGHIAYKVPIKQSHCINHAYVTPIPKP